MTWSIGWRKPHCILGHCLNPSQSIPMRLNASKPPHFPTHSISLPSASQSPSSPAGPWLRRPLPSSLPTSPQLALSLHHTSRVHSTTSDQSIPTLSELPSLSHFLNFSPTTSEMKLPMGTHINQFLAFYSSQRQLWDFGTSKKSYFLKDKIFIKMPNFLDILNWNAFLALSTQSRRNG